MQASGQRRMSVKDAAEIIFRTSQPTPEQLQRVQELLVPGELQGDSRGTTANAVADFVARSALNNAPGKQHANARRTSHKHDERLNRVYRESLKDYFLAVIMRRKIRNASKFFQHAVLAGQIVLLAAIVGAILASVRMVFPPTRPEHAAVVRWLDENAHRHRVVKWHPTKTGDDGKTQLWVEYHYVTPQGRGIDTRRVFTVDGDRVVSVDSEE